MFRRVFLGLAIALLAFEMPAPAQERRPVPYGDNVQPLDHILPGIRSNRPGRFFDAEGPYADAVGGWHYRIKWLSPEGRVIWLDADARTGRVIGPYSGFHPGFMMPPSGLRYYRGQAPVPGGRGRFGGWRGGWRPGGWGFGGGRRR